MALLKKIGEIFKRTFNKQKRIHSESEPPGDRLEAPEKGPILGIGLRGKFSRRYLILAGSYLLTVVVLLSFIVVRWGKIPSWEVPGLPGVEKESEYQLQEEKKILQNVGPIVPEDAIISGVGNANASGSVNDEQETGNIDLVPVQEENGQPLSVLEGEMSATSRVVLPQAAMPLPQWHLQCPFGSYMVEKLPSGGSLHRLSQGVLLRTTPAAPVSAIWAGKVVSTGDSDSPRGLSVLLEHEGGYYTFYDNLCEVWVEEGNSIKEGEGIGLLPQSPPLEEAAGAATTGQLPDGAWELPMRSIWSGYYDEETGTILQVLQPDHSSSFDSGTGFYEESPLLYLEVRLGQKCLDPLEFIPDRN